MKPTHLDLFSGIGGFSLAFEAAGFETIGFSEIDEYASAVLNRHWPHVRNFGDFRNTPDEYVDVVTAGVPCQPASLAGNQLGTTDERWLWGGAVDKVRRIRPAFALFENVPGLLALDGGLAFNRILSDLHSGGFACWWTHLPACSVGSPQLRDRLYIVAHSAALHGRPRDSMVPSGERGSSVESGRLPWLAMASKWTPENEWFEREPRLARLVDGISNRTHRLECTGNTIIPQVAYLFAKAILAEIKR